MKKFIILFLFITATMFSQGWNNAVQTTIPFSYATNTSIDQFANKDGIHVLTVSSDLYPRYYLINSSGSLIRSYTIENQQVQFASIDGDNDRIYVVYRLGNQIKTKKSVNAGQSWSNIADINIGNNTCNHIDITFGKDDNALHVVWATQDAGSNYKTYYQRLPSSDQWEQKEDVTDGKNVGGFPTVSKSPNRIYVGYSDNQQSDPWTTGNSTIVREKIGSVWQTPQMTNLYSLSREKVHAGHSKLFDFFYKAEGLQFKLYVTERYFGSSSWSSPILLQAPASPEHILSAINTFDSKTHIIYEIWGGVGYRNYNGSSWSSETTLGSGYDSPRIYSVSNDLYTVWGDWSSGKIMYRQYDANPLTPTNLSVSVHSENGSGYPKLTWALNNEPDVRANSTAYVIERRIDDLGNGNWTEWDPLTEETGTTNVHIDYTISGAGSGPSKAQYRIQAKDIGTHTSDFSSAVQISYGTGYWKIGNDESDLPREFSLNNNYPNPFNPSTRIKYAIPQEALVKVAVYDMLGREIAVLANEQKQPGNYEVEWSAGGISSGIYVYRITALNGDKILFNQSKQMILMK